MAAGSERREGVPDALAGLRREGYGPRAGHQVQDALRAAGYANSQVGDLYGVGKWTAGARIGDHRAVVEHWDIGLGAAGSVSVTICRRPGSPADGKLARFRELIGDLEAVAVPATPDGFAPVHQAVGGPAV